MWEHKEEHTDFLIHDKHGLPSVYIKNYPKYTPLVAAALQYKQYIENKEISEEQILAKSDGYPMSPTRNNNQPQDKAWGLLLRMYDKWLR